MSAMLERLLPADADLPELFGPGPRVVRCQRQGHALQLRDPSSTARRMGHRRAALGGDR
ncbi:UNVERIFIED_CONTAM: hypothetical protein GTU68_042979 [Idotea baltica]|nr:hypothetical protein [Idotea baltica]